MLKEKTDRRDSIIFDECEVLQSSGGIRRFQNLDTSRLQKLIEEQIANANMYQNEGPTIRKFLHFGLVESEDLEQRIFYEGYVYTNIHNEYDLSPIIDGVREVIKKDDVGGIIRFVKLFHNADEFSINTSGDNIFMRAWWD